MRLKLEVDKIIQIEPVVEMSPDDNATTTKLPSTFNLDNLKKLLNQDWFTFMPVKFSHVPQDDLFYAINEIQIRDSLFDFSPNAPVVKYNFLGELFSLANLNDITAITSEDTYSQKIMKIIMEPAVLYKIRREKSNLETLIIESNRRQMSTDSNSATSSQSAGKLMKPNENVDHERSIAWMRPDFALKDQYSRFGWRGKKWK